MNENQIATLCKALGDENRVKIIQLLTKGELCACHILEAFNITQPTLSHHMKILSECNLVNGRKDGKWMHYSINYKTFCEFQIAIDEICKSKIEGPAGSNKCCCGGEK